MAFKTKAIPTPKNWKELEPHPLAELADYGVGINQEELTRSIQEDGFDPDEPIIEYEGKILNGRHRRDAAKDAGVTPPFARFLPDGPEDAISYAKRKILRQHLSISQLALYAARLVVASKNGDGREPIAIEEAARMVDVSARSVSHGVTVVEEGTENLQKAVSSDEITVSDAASIAEEPPKVQNQAVRDVVSGKVPTATASAEIQAILCPRCTRTGASNRKCLS